MRSTEKIKLFFLFGSTIAVIIFMIFLSIFSGKPKKELKLQESQAAENTQEFGLRPSTNFLPKSNNKNKANKENKYSEVVNAKKLYKLSDLPVLSFDIFLQNPVTVSFVRKNDSHLFKKTINSNKEMEIVKKTIPYPLKAVFLDENRYIIQYQDKDVIKTVLFNGQNSVFLPDDIVSVEATANGELLFAQEDNQKNANVYRYNENGYVLVTQLPFSDIKVIPFKNKTLILQNPSNFYLNSLFELKDGKLLPIIYSKRFLTVKKDDSTLFVSFIEGGKPKLFYLKPDNSLDNLDFEALAEKCVASKAKKDTFYCFAPEKFPKNLVDFLYDRALGKERFAEVLWKVENGKAKVIYPVPGVDYMPIDATNVIISDNEKIFFKNLYDNNIYFIDAGN